MFRTFDIMDAELTKYKIKSQKPDFYISPNLGDMDPYRFKLLENAYIAGYEVGKENADKIKKAIGMK